jgi:hypothetical protein
MGAGNAIERSHKNINEIRNIMIFDFVGVFTNKSDCKIAYIFME